MPTKSAAKRPRPAVQPQRDKPLAVGPDGYAVLPDDPLAHEHLVLNDAILAARQANGALYAGSTAGFIKRLRAMHRANAKRVVGPRRDADAGSTVPLLHAAAARWRRLRTIHRYEGDSNTLAASGDRRTLSALLVRLLDSAPALSDADVLALLDTAVFAGRSTSNALGFPASPLLRAVERHVAATALSPQLRRGLLAWREAISPQPQTPASMRRLRALMDTAKLASGATRALARWEVDRLVMSFRPSLADERQLLRCFDQLLKNPPTPRPSKR